MALCECDILGLAIVIVLLMCLTDGFAALVYILLDVSLQTLPLNRHNVM